MKWLSVIISTLVYSCIFLLDKPASVTSHHVLYIWSLPVSTLSSHSWVDRWWQFHFENEDEQFKRLFFSPLASIKEPLSVNHAGSRGWDALRNRIAQLSFWHLAVWSELKIHFLFDSWYVSVHRSLSWPAVCVWWLRHQAWGLPRAFSRQSYSNSHITTVLGSHYCPSKHNDICRLTMQIASREPRHRLSLPIKLVSAASKLPSIPALSVSIYIICLADLFALTMVQCDYLGWFTSANEAGGTFIISGMCLCYFLQDYNKTNWQISMNFSCVLVRPKTYLIIWRQMS